jgi:Mce-associated membrane protein
VSPSVMNLLSAVMSWIAALVTLWRGGPLRVAMILVAALALIACVIAGWFGLSWYRIAHDESITVGMVRDAVLQDAQQAAINVNTLDYRQVQGGFALWEQSATGAALEEFRQNRDAYVRTVTESKTTSTARVREAAVAELNDRAGTARVLVGVDVTYTPEQREASCVRQRLQLQMKHTPEGWKVDQLAPIGALEPTPGPCPASGPGDSPN